MKRLTGITVTAAAAMLGTVLAFLFVVAFARTFVAPGQPPPGISLALLRIGQIIAVTMFALLGIWAAITAGGLWKLKGWARWSVLIYGGLLVFVSLPAMFFVLLLPFPQAPNVPPAVMDRTRWGIGATYALLSLFGAWLLYYFNRASTRAAFEGTPLDHDSRRPMSITLIGAYLILAGISSTVLVFIPFPASVLGMMLEGIPARLFYLASAIAYISIGIGLLRLWPASRIAAMAILAFALVNSTVFLLLPGLQERIAAFSNSYSTGLPVNGPLAMMPFTVGSLIFGVLIIAVVMWFLNRNRSAFETQQLMEPSA